MTDLAGPVALALVGLWIAYLVPHKLRHRQQLLESRSDDRYSEALRVVAVSDRHGRSARGTDGASGSRPAERSTTGRSTTGRSTTGLLTPGSGVPVTRPGPVEGGTAVDRPTATQDRLATEHARRAAQARAAHAAALARRGAAARRRGLLAGALLLATVAGWVVVGVAPAVTWVVAAVPTALLTGVVVLGRRAVLAGRAADAAWERQDAELQRAAVRPATPAAGLPSVARGPRATHVGRAFQPSDEHTQVIPTVGATVRSSSAAATEGETGEGWSPVAVPRPTYAMKAPAPRREPAPLGDVEGSTTARPAAAASDKPAAQVTPAASSAVSSAVVPDDVPVATTGSIDLDAVLAKRRAVGE
ncbi:hypothetical protein [Cellulomonas sp. HZM]|uniref:hypothetical protein n=1 Tax=Cellulomonas sp. HZM TaxID=1454010 RepID=UPI000493A0E5|nr:hypothetical protein [Cellulomonas sp. HZM]